VPDPAPERLVVGLGNPGPRHAATRHNAGFRVLERLAERHDVGWRLEAGLDAELGVLAIAGIRCALLRPQTFMNRSGASVAAALSRWPGLDPARDLLVVYDDLDLPPGRLRLRPSGSAGGQRGMADVLDRLGSRDVPRLRFGIGRPGPEAGVPVLDWVLGPFASELEPRALSAVLDRAAQAIEVVVGEGMREAMERFNADA